MTTLTQHRPNPDLHQNHPNHDLPHHHHPYGLRSLPTCPEPLPAGAAAVAGGRPLVTQPRPIVWLLITVVLISLKKMRMKIDVQVCSTLTTIPRPTITESVYDTDINGRNTGPCRSSYFSVNDRLRPYLFDLGSHNQPKRVHRRLGHYIPILILL
jgi:hypothetical protein